MTIRAKYAGTCPACSRPISVGDFVEWNKGSRAIHPACAGMAASTGAAVRPAAAAPRATRRPRTARHCEGWGADNPHAPRPDYTCTECE